MKTRVRSGMQRQEVILPDAFYAVSDQIDIEGGTDADDFFLPCQSPPRSESEDDAHPSGDQADRQQSTRNEVR